MARKLTLTDFLKNPLTVAAALVAALQSVLHLGILEAFVLTVWQNPGTLFTALSVTSFTLGEHVDFIPQRYLIVATLLVGVVFVLKLTDSFWDNFKERL